MKLTPGKDELMIDVNGYSDASILGCDDDCPEFFEKVSGCDDGCGWYQLPKPAYSSKNQKGGEIVLSLSIFIKRKENKNSKNWLLKL